MDEAQNRMIYLLRQYADDLCTAPELVELLDVIKASQQDETLYGFLQDEWNNIRPVTVSKEPDWNWVYQSIITKPIIPIYKRKAFRWVAAACIIIAIATLAVVGVFTNNHKPTPAVATTHDVPAPTNTRAVITLADGSKVYLDSAGNGVLAQQNNVKVVRNEKGEIVYERSPNHQITRSPDHQITYNTLFNPRGSKVISLTLSDGTKVWLNAESSLRYPASFAPSAVNREVEITGEAYFEVAHVAGHIARGFNPGNKSPQNTQGFSPIPFKVHLPNGSIVEDIGTSFNVNAYPDEESIKTTLIEGAVKISASSANTSASSAFLKPGEQAIATGHSLFTTRSVDLDEVMAWKNGLFSFKSAGITTVMRQLERWYDLDITYTSIPTEKFHVEMNRNTNLSNVFRILEETGGVHFKIEGKKIIVSK